MRYGAVLLLSAAAGCVDFGTHDARVPGHDLGVFGVVANLEESTCGLGALGSEEVWEFDVRLSRDAPHLTWLTGSTMVSGQIAADGESFSLESVGSHELEEPQRGHQGCVVVRHDRATGKLLNAGTEVVGFAGQLGHAFAADSQSDCSALIGAPDGFRLLPCEINYRMQAERRVPPETP